MKTRNSLVSNSSSSSFIIAFNPDYNMKGKKVINHSYEKEVDKADGYEDYPFTKFIEMYGQEKCIFNNVEEWIDSHLECYDPEDMNREQYIDENQEVLKPMEFVQKHLPANWKWAHLWVMEGTNSRLGKIVEAMADQCIVDDCGRFKGENNSDINLKEYDFENGYMLYVAYMFQ